MNDKKENLEGIVSKLKEQGINAGEEEKKRIIADAKAQADKIVADAKAQAEKSLEEANNKAAQIQKNADMAIAQASRDMVEATKIAMIDSLKSVFGEKCESLFTEKQYLKELVKVVVESISGEKTISIPKDLTKDMEAFLVKESLDKKVAIKPLANGNALIKVDSSDKKGVQFVLSAQDVEESMFSLLNKDLVEKIKQNQEA